MRTLVFTLLLGLGPTPSIAAPSLVINEIHYHPPGSADPTEEFIELFNPTDTPVDLHGWRVDGGIEFRFDRASGPTTIAAGGFLVVGKSPEGLARAANLRGPAMIAGPFSGKLSNFGERVSLLDANGVRVDSVAYRQDGDWPARADGLGSSLQRVSPTAPGRLPRNWAVAATGPAPTSRVPVIERRVRGLPRGLERVRIGPNGRVIVEPATPRTPPAPSIARDFTPGRANAVAAMAVPPLVQFVDRSPREPSSTDEVTLRARIAGTNARELESVTLFYDAGNGAGERSMRFDATIDGLHSVVVPAAPSGSIVRFRIVARGRDGGETHCPRFGNPVPWLAYRVADDSLTEPDIARRSSDDVDVYHLLWDGPLSCQRGAWRRDCVFVHDGTAYLDVGLRYRGQTSCGQPKTGFKIEFRRGALFKGQRQLNLAAGWQDRSLLREKLAWDLYRDVGHPACRAKPAIVFSHGGEFHGLFIAIEEPSGEYLRRHRIANANGLWKSFASFLGVRSRRAEAFVRLDGDDAPDDHSAILELERSLLTLSGRALTAFIEKHVDIESLLDYQAIKCLTSDEDGYSKNWLLVRRSRRSRDGSPRDRWSIHPWDLDLSFGQRSLNDEDIVVDKHPLSGTIDHPRHGSHGQRFSGIIEAVFGRRSNDYFTRALYGRIHRALEEKFHPAILGPKIERLDAATIAAARLDLERWPRWGERPTEPGPHRERLRTYCEFRYEYLRRFLATEHATAASATGPWEPVEPPRVAVGTPPPRALSYRTFRYSPAPRMKITEIHYHPGASDDDESLEFIEARNLEARTVDVSGWSVPAVGWVFPSKNAIPAGATFVIARDRSALRAGHAGLDESLVFGPYPGRLSNRGEVIRLRDSGLAAGKRAYPETIDAVRYGDEAPWPIAADGDGSSLELRELKLDNDLPESWRASARSGGTPGR